MKVSQYLVLVVLCTMIVFTSSDEVSHQFCWKDSYGRGVGTIPGECGNRDKIGLLCYDKCGSGYKRFGVDCHQTCPSGWKNQGLFCRLAEYGRGAGFPWKFKDGFSWNGRISRCEAKHGKGNCEKWGAIAYPKCRSGYKPFGCCICRPSVPDCPKFGMNKGIDLSCAKKIKIGKPYSADCPSSKDNNAGLCYKKCRQNYYGAGPVCWSKNPDGWVGCGMGAAKDTGTCAQQIFDQVASVGELALNAATLGSSKAAATGAKASKLKEKFEQIKKAIMENDKIKNAVKKTQDFYQKNEEAIQAAQKAAEVAGALEEMLSIPVDELTPADYVRIIAEVASIFDPTGIFGVIAAYSHPKCSTIFG